ncbi:MAG: HEAT repeat domain-containing protein [Spirochaetes bacterium]|nr:HEAT repeat domain-containing protein [Spirochaetota bacterium]
MAIRNINDRLPRIFNKNEKFIKIFLLMCLNLLLFLLCYICAIQIIHAETAQPDISKNSQLIELNIKLNQLNASIAAMNNDQKSNSKNEAENTDLKDNDIKTRNNKKKIDKTDKAEIQKTSKDKKTDTKPEATINKEYAAEKKKAEWIITTIESGTHKDRKSAINQILTIKDKNLKKNLGEKLIEVIQNEVELEVKVKAITVSGEIKTKEAIPVLITSLDDETDDVKVAAVYAIKRIGDISTKANLITKIKEQKLENTTNFIEALIDTLGEFKATELSGFASESIKSTKTHQIIRELFVLFLGKIESKEPKDTLLELLKDEDENEQIRAFAANSLGNLQITEAIPDIEKVVKTIDSYSFNKKKKYNNLYIYCVSALAKLGYENAFPLFLNMLRSDNAVVRLKAVSLVKGINDKRTIDILKYKMNYDPSPKVQSAAKDALKELGVDVESVNKDKTKIEQDSKYNLKNEDEKKEEARDDSGND